MSEQSEALLLADALCSAPERSKTSFDAAEELRRLHELNGELLAVLEDIEMVGDENGGVGTYLAHLARKAIAKTEGKKA